MVEDPTDDLRSQDLVKRVEKDQVKYIDLQFTDVGGMVKNVTIPTSQLLNALRSGVWFDGSSIEGFARVAESDMHLRPDINTYSIIPWLNGDEATARLICDVYMPNGLPFPGDPRAVLRRILSEAAEMGLCFQAGPEIEFFLLKVHPDGSVFPPVPHDAGSYFDAPSDMAAGLRRQMADVLTGLGIQVESMHHEGAAGQHEIDFRYSDALTAADHVVTLRVALKVVAQMNGLYATFLPKPFRGINGSGMHVHQSLVYLANGKNAFADPADSHGLSRLARNFIAGQLAHAPGMCAILAPLVNSYKRLVEGYEAPVSIRWARTNQSALIRVPRASHTESTRLELRCPDPCCNPYLAFAAMLAAGLDGIRNDLSAPEATEENTFSGEVQRQAGVHVLPGSLDHALDALEQDEVIKTALGANILDRFVSAKRQEWEDYRLEVSSWELGKYLPRY